MKGRRGELGWRPGCPVKQNPFVQSNRIDVGVRTEDEGGASCALPTLK